MGRESARKPPEAEREEMKKIKKENSDNVNKKEEALSEQLELTKSDEDSLLKLMNECDFATTNAEMFIERLQTELVYLDTVRIAFCH